MNFTKNIGMLLLAIFLIIYGVMTAFQVQLPLIIPGLLALLAGIFILIGK